MSVHRNNILVYNSN